MKSTVLAAILFLLTVDTQATDLSSSLNLNSSLIYRGHQISDNSSVGLTLKVDELLDDRVYLNLNFDSLSNSTKSDFELGFRSFFNKYDYSVTLAKVNNSIIYEDHSELRIRANYKNFFGMMGYGLSSNNKDTYVELGMKQENFPCEKLTSGIVASIVYHGATIVGQIDDNIDGVEYNMNNVRIYSTYELSSTLDLTANYSFGGQIDDETDIGNYAWLSLGYKF